MLTVFLIPHGVASGLQVVQKSLSILRRLEFDLAIANVQVKASQPYGNIAGADTKEKPDE